MSTLWKPVDAALGIWVHGYAFNGIIINTLAISIGDRKLMIVSPGTNPTPELFDELETLGTPAAISSPGAFHHLGMPAWKERYPDVPFYATSSGLTHIAKQHKGLDLGLQGPEALAAILPEHITAEETPGKHPDQVLFIRDADGGCTWFTNEILGNQATLPPNFIIRTMFKWTNSGPGLAVTTPALWLTGIKKPALRPFLLERLDRHTPTRLVPCHGDVLDTPDVAGQIREVVERSL